MSWHDMEAAAEHEALRLWLVGDTIEEGGDAGGFFVRVLGNAVIDLPRLGQKTDHGKLADPVREAGYRVWIMASRYAPAVCPKSNRADMMEMRRIALEFSAFMGLVMIDSEKAMAVFELLIGKCHSARCIGKRAMILAYQLCTTPQARVALPSMAKIGEMWGLGAKNKRSAVAAACKKIKRETIEKARRSDRFLEEIQLWYSKQAQTREKYRQAQMGNSNRSAPQAEDEVDEQIQAEASEMRQGIPVRAEYAGLRAEVLRAKMNALHEQAEARRLAAL